VARSRNISAYNAILTAWYNFIRRGIIWRFNVAGNSNTCVLVLKWSFLFIWPLLIRYVFPQRVCIKVSNTKFKSIRPERATPNKRTDKWTRQRLKTLFVSKRRRPQASYIAISNSSTLYIYRTTRRHIKQFQLHITQYYVQCT